jgi:hypothetical protein
MSNMASSSSMPTTIPTSFSIRISEELTKVNYCLWRAQILPPIRVAMMEDLLLSVEKMSPNTIIEKTSDTLTEKSNPEYVS